MRNFIVFCFLSLAGFDSSTLFADVTLGIEINGHPRSLDLVNAGVHTKPYLSEDAGIEWPKPLMVRLEEVLKDVADEDVLNIVSSKLGHFHHQIESEHVTFPIYQTVTNTQKFWSWEQSSRDCSLGLGTRKFVVAERRGNTILLCSAFLRMPAADRAAVLLSQLLVSRDERVKSRSRLIGLLFSTDLKRATGSSRKRFRNIVSAAGEHLNGNAYGILDRVQLSDEALMAANIPANQSLCAGSGSMPFKPDASEVFVQVWLSDPHFPCQNYVYFTHPRTFTPVAKSNGSLTVFDLSTRVELEVGRYDFKSKKIESLCSGPYEDRCRIEKGELDLR